MNAKDAPTSAKVNFAPASAFLPSCMRSNDSAAPNVLRTVTVRNVSRSPSYITATVTCAVPAFLKVLDSCEGEVYLMTRDGDRLNLKSKLCQLVGLTALIEGGKIAEAFVMCEKESDESKLFRFNLYKHPEDVEE